MGGLEEGGLREEESIYAPPHTPRTAPPNPLRIYGRTDGRLSVDGIYGRLSLYGIYGRLSHDAAHRRAAPRLRPAFAAAHKGGPPHPKAGRRTQRRAAAPKGGPPHPFGPHPKAASK